LQLTFFDFCLPILERYDLGQYVGNIAFNDGVVIVVYGEGFVSGEPYSFLRTDLR
tara:strand:- start:4915 stop:5079 length:165 start_codon:yes stop_codon:yes gene_type:complete